MKAKVNPIIYVVSRSLQYDNYENMRFDSISAFDSYDYAQEAVERYRRKDFSGIYGISAEEDFPKYFEYRLNPKAIYRIEAITLHLAPKNKGRNPL